MKTTITKKLLGLALSVFSITAAAQCPSVNNMSVTLGTNGTATVTPILSSANSTLTMYYWSVTPNATQTSSTWQPNGTFQFPTNGTYTLSVFITDSLNGCSTNGSTVLNITNMSASACNAAFTYYTDSACVTHFINSSTGNNLSYSWNINGNSYSSINPSVSLSNGTYPVVLFTYSGGNLCDSIYQSTTVSCGGGGTTTPCQASFYTYTDSSCVTHFVNTSTAGNSVVWNINGMTYTSAPSIALANGNHYVTLYSYMPAGGFCDSTSQMINVACGSGTTTPCQASFYTYTDSSCVTHFVNSTPCTYSVSSWNINGTMYYTPSPALSLTNGNYFVILNASIIGSGVSTSSNVVNVACNSGTTTPSACQANSNFYVFPDSTNAGNYFAYNLSSGTGNVSYLWNFGDGTTSTQQYPFHQYAVPGQYIICLTVSATSGTTTCTDTDCDSSSVQRMVTGFVMSQVNVIAQAATGIKQAEILTGLNAYPNPIADELTIEATTKDNSKLNYNLIDALGRSVLTGSVENSKAIINTSSLEKGFYSLSITNENGSSLKAIKLVK
jgi:PKD repeat protein